MRSLNEPQQIPNKLCTVTSWLSVQSEFCGVLRGWTLASGHRQGWIGENREHFFGHEASVVPTHVGVNPDQ